MHSFLFLCNNIIMREIIVKFKKIIKEYHIGVLVASNTFYLILLIIPLKQVGYIDDFSITNIIDIFGLGIIFLINIMFVASKYLHSLRMTSDLIYEEIPLRKSFKERLKTFLLVICLLLFVISLLIISFGLVKLWVNVIGSMNYMILKVIEYIVSFSIILLVGMIIFKYTLPIFVELSDALKISLVLALIWVFFSTIYQLITNLLKNIIFNNIINETILLIYFLYSLNYIIILSFIYYYIKIKNKQKNMNKIDNFGLKYNEHY